MLYCVLRMQLKATGSPYSPERALEIVRHIQFHQVRIAGQGAASGLTDLSPEPRAARLVRSTTTRHPHQRALRHRPAVPIPIA